MQPNSILDDVLQTMALWSATLGWASLVSSMMILLAQPVMTAFRMVMSDVDCGAPAQGVMMAVPVETVPIVTVACRGGCLCSYTQL